MMEVKEIINLLRKAEGYISFNAEYANEVADTLEELENINSKWNEIYESYRERLIKFRKENEDLKKQLAEKPEWISVAERLPETRDNVLVYASDIRQIYMAFYFDGSWWQYGTPYIGVNSVTHWMPLPEPPKPKGQTFKDVFLKAFPKAAMEMNGPPKACLENIFPYVKHTYCENCACYECWNQPYFETEGERNA